MNGNTLDVVRSIVGRRHKITREEMAQILLALPIDLPAASTIVGRAAQDGSIYVGQRTWPAVDADAAIARVWANMCTDITVISAWGRGPDDYPGNVRYDSPGSMAPMQRAELAFVSAACEGDECGTIDYIRRHALRVLVVRDDPPLADPAAISSEPEETDVPAWVMRMRKHERVDGTWTRILDDGTLEMRDPNDGQSSDIADKCRFQYRVDEDGSVLRRRLPPESVGDEWRDIGVPDWESGTTPPRDDFIRLWWEEQVM